MAVIGKDAKKLLIATGTLYRTRSQLSNINEQQGLFSPSSILIAARVVSSETEYATLLNNEREWIRWYSAFEDLDKSGMLKVSIAGGLAVVGVRMEQHGLEELKIIQEPWWSKAGHLLFVDLRTIVVGVISGVAGAVLTVIVMRLLGFVK